VYLYGDVDVDVDVDLVADLVAVAVPLLDAMDW